MTTSQKAVEILSDTETGYTIQSLERNKEGKR